MLLSKSTGMNKSLCQCHPPSSIDRQHIIATVTIVNTFEKAKITTYIMTNVFPPPVNTAIIILFTKPLFITYKYELIDSTHTLIEKVFLRMQHQFA